MAKHPIRDPLVPADAPVSVAVTSWPASQRVRGLGCSAYISRWRRAPHDVAPAKIKAVANYHNGRMAVLDAREHGCDWPIMLNTGGTVSESAGANVFLVQGGELITPSDDQDILPGITRDTVTQLSRTLGISVQRRPVSVDDLAGADELFFTGTAWEILPVISMPHLRFNASAVGPVTASLMAAYHQLVRGKGGHPNFTTPVPQGNVNL